MPAGSVVHGASHIGKLVGARYRPTRVLGSGGMGHVYEALDLATDRSVALKVLHPYLVRSAPTAGARFEREAKAARTVKHPAIVELLDFGTDADGTPFIAFELLEGMDLETSLNKGLHVSDADIVHFGLRVLDALETVHQSGFVHRDVKPANIFLAPEPDGSITVKLLDFGVAKSLEDDSLTMQGTTVGTLEYMSPEQALAEQIDGRCDVWGIGATMYRAYGGRPPIAAASVREMITRLIQSRAPSLATLRPDLDPKLVAVIDRALERSPAARWATATAMRDALAEVCEAPMLGGRHSLTAPSLRADELIAISSSELRVPSDQRGFDLATERVDPDEIKNLLDQLGTERSKLPDVQLPGVQLIDAYNSSSDLDGPTTAAPAPELEETLPPPTRSRQPAPIHSLLEAMRAGPGQPPASPAGAAGPRPEPRATGASAAPGPRQGSHLDARSRPPDAGPVWARMTVWVGATVVAVLLASVALLLSDEILEMIGGASAPIVTPIDHP